ncbi:MAG TPA: sugar ABC transporter permease [Anaerolineaceae bacterium]|nr:sugar ABC transporter permease [Anaerolineaceae bacterium]
MVGWSGRRTALTVLLFLLPTILGLLIFNIYPLILNTYVSFTNRNKFHPNPDCSAGLNGALDPTCWPVFKGKAPVGLATPYGLANPIYKNYSDLVGKLFNTDALFALLKLLFCFVPLVIAGIIEGRLEKQVSRTIPGIWIWLSGIVGVVVLMIVVNVAGTLDTLMNTGDFFVVIFRTILFVLVRVPISFVVGLVLALILNSPNLPGKTFFRVVLFVPWAASSVAILIALIWQFIFRDQGVINQVLKVIGIIGPVWLNNPTLAFGVVVLADVYFSYGFFMVSILGALQAIPVEMYEAAEVDGAGWWTQLTSITLPLIRPAIMPAIVLTSISAFQMFGTAYAMTQGGPVTDVSKPGATDFVMVYAFKQIYQSQNYGRATAFATIVFVLLFVATLYSLRLTRITKSAYTS